MKKLLIISSFLLFLFQDGFAWGINNKDPKNGMIGFSFTPILPTGGDGHTFEDDKDSPHPEYGLAGGLDYWKRYGRAYDTHLALDLKYQQYHFHHGLNQKNGQFRFLHVTVPASLHYPIPNYSYMFFKVGVALSSANIFQQNIGFVDGNKYFTTFKTSWLIYPEMTLGFDILEEKTQKFYFRAGIDYTFVPISKMGEFRSSVSSNGIIETSSGSFTPNKFQLKITFYPFMKKEFNHEKQGHRCPSPF